MWTSSSPGVDVRCMNGVEEKLSHADPFHVNEVGLEQSFWGLEPLPSHLNNPAVRELEIRGFENEDFKALNQSPCQFINIKSFTQHSNRVANTLQNHKRLMLLLLI